MRITPGCASPPDAHHPRRRITPGCASPDMHVSVIFDILEPSAFQKYSACRVFSILCLCFGGGLGCWLLGWSCCCISPGCFCCGLSSLTWWLFSHSSARPGGTTVLF